MLRIFPKMGLREDRKVRNLESPHGAAEKLEWRLFLRSEPSAKKQYDENNQNDSTDPDSAIRSVGVVATAATKQQE